VRRLPEGGAIQETAGARLRRRATHLIAHPGAWLRYVWLTEVRHREVRFRENPRFLDWRPMFRVARGPLAGLLGVPVETLDGYFAEIGPLHEELLRSVGDLPSAGALMQAPILYVLARVARPNWAIETGISSGLSARLLVEALRANGGGHLDSIGLDEFALRDPAGSAVAGLGGRRVGWLVPEGFRDLWTLRVGRSDAVLPALLTERGEGVDLFLHDSLHQYATMRWEYECVLPRIAPGGFLLSHDIHANAAWPETVARHRLDRSIEADHDLGIAVVPGPAR